MDAITVKFVKVGSATLEVGLRPGTTVVQGVNAIKEEWQRLRSATLDLTGFKIRVNGEDAADNDVLEQGDVITAVDQLKAG